MSVVLLTLAATLAIQLGYFLWKQASATLPNLGNVSLGKAIKGFISNRRWLFGLICTIVGWILFIKATDLGEISVVQPLMSVGDIFLIFLAVVFLHERLTRNEWIGLTFTVAGAIALSFDARVTAPLLIEWTLLWELMAAIFFMGILVYLWGLRSQRPEIPLAIAVGFGFGIGAVLTELMTAYVTLGGKEIESSALVLNPILPFMIVANVIGLFLLQFAFQRGRASIIIPVQLSVVNGIVLLVGMLVFSEAVTAYRVSAVLIMVFGTGWLHRGQINQSPQI